MSSHPLDKSFKAKLGNGSAQVPDGMWGAIETQLPQPAKPGRAWLIGLLGLTVLSLATAIGWSQFTGDAGNETPMVNNVTVLAEENPTSQKEQETTSVAPSENNQNIELTTPLAGEEKEDLGDDKDLAQNTALASADQSSHTSLGIGNSSELTLESTETRSTVRSEMGIRSNEVLGVTDLKEDEIAEETEEPYVRPSIMLQFAGNTESILAHSYDADGAVTDCYSFGKPSRGTFVLEIFTGPTYSLKSMDSRDEDVSGYITGRDSTENGQISWHAGLRVGYEHVSGLTAKAGIQYAMVNELFKQVSRTSGIRIDSIFDTMGNLVRVDSTLVEGERVKQTQNRYHSIDIPLIVGYRIDNGNWDFGIEAGPIFNISYKAKGDMINATGEPFSFSDESDPNYQPVFNTSLGIGLFAGIYASKRVADKLWVFVEPNVHHRFKSVTRDDFAIDQRQTNISLSLGLRYKL